jgi:hypothetical protein
MSGKGQLPEMPALQRVLSLLAPLLGGISGDGRMSFRRCQTCRIWPGCAGFAWYQPGEIESQFCFNMIFWIIRNAEDLSIGVYPADPVPTGYTGGSAPRFSAGAKFQKANDIHGEFDRRLKRTGDKGKVLVHEVNVLGAESFYQLSLSAREAIGYCAGRNAKRRTFAQWLADKDYERRHKLIKISGLRAELIRFER